jgi:hypothetical protein
MILYAHYETFDEEETQSQPVNHGTQWSCSDVDRAVQGLMIKQPIDTLSKILGRTSYAVCLKLKSKGLLFEDPINGNFYIDENSELSKSCNAILKNIPSKLSNIQPTKPAQKENMKTLQNQTLVLGVDISTAKAGQCLSLITSLKEKQKTLLDLGIESSYVNKELKDISEALAIVIKQLDSLA